MKPMAACKLEPSLPLHHNAEARVSAGSPALRNSAAVLCAITLPTSTP